MVAMVATVQEYLSLWYPVTQKIVPNLFIQKYLLSFRELLSRSRVMAQIEKIPFGDSFYASKRGKIDR